ncbi:hypothetical protein [Ornithinimicrobium kibberense]|uniref:hypothetical protein n=1 Tax=Ornithinimicrobium kibberense TaxID=282060 RepID=UPI003610B6E2
MRDLPVGARARGRGPARPRPGAPDGLPRADRVRSALPRGGARRGPAVGVGARAGRPGGRAADRPRRSACRTRDAAHDRAAAVGRPDVTAVGGHGRRRHRPKRGRRTRRRALGPGRGHPPGLLVARGPGALQRLRRPGRAHAARLGALAGGAGHARRRQAAPLLRRSGRPAGRRGRGPGRSPAGRPPQRCRGAGAGARPAGRPLPRAPGPHAGPPAGRGLRAAGPSAGGPAGPGGRPVRRELVSGSAQPRGVTRRTTSSLPLEVVTHSAPSSSSTTDRRRP